MEMTVIDGRDELIAYYERKGYALKVVMPENVTPERTQLLRMYGAEIVYSPGDQGSNGAVAMALAMASRLRTAAPNTMRAGPGPGTPVFGSGSRMR